MRRKYWGKLPENGVFFIEINSWKDLVSFLNNDILQACHFVWRGQQKTDWLLESSIDRIIRTRYKCKRRDLIEHHMTYFKHSILGRRGLNPCELDDDEYWALGQHFGLVTPLLDWSSSPYVAVYFAVYNILMDYFKNNGVYQDDKRYALYALDRYKLQQKCENLDDTDKIKIIEPLLEENSRLINQSGLFTKLPHYTDVESWVTDNFKGECEFVLFKIFVSFKDIEEIKNIMSSLNRMNIRPSSLFPDISGASMYCNLKLLMPIY